MITMQLSEAAATLGATLRGADSAFTGCGTDTRSLQVGQLFIALTGPHFDAHQFVGEARDKGAVAAMVDQDIDDALPLLQVSDTRRAMGELAAAWRSRFELPLIGVTGSNGKTTVKEMLTGILELSGEVLATQGNFNNDIGVPLTLFRMDASNQYAVIEMGANHVGEIQGLVDWVKPTVGVVTLCAPAHLEGFGSIENVAREKGEVFAGLDSNGTAVINADDSFADSWKQQAGDRSILTFGLSAVADVTANDIQTDIEGSQFGLVTAQGTVTVRLQLPGLHNIRNALAAAAAALAVGIELDLIRRGLEQMQSVPGRLRRLPGVLGSSLIDDSYNANPGSLQAALDVLAASQGDRWLVLGEMGELGSRASDVHVEAGESARAAGVQRLFGLGELAVHACTGFGSGATHFDNVDDLIAALRQDLQADTSVLIKGSRYMRMERIVSALAEGD